MRPLRHDAGLYSYIEILRFIQEVGLFNALDRHSVFGHDLDVGHPFLAGKGRKMEGADLWGKTGGMNALFVRFALTRTPAFLTLLQKNWEELFLPDVSTGVGRADFIT